LTVYWNSGACEPLPLELTETDDQVAIRVTERWSRGAVAAIAVGRRASITLAQPLGTRTVLVATTKKPRPRA
jgi:hypothetical protein